MALTCKNKAIRTPVRIIALPTHHVYMPHHTRSSRCTDSVWTYISQNDGKAVTHDRYWNTYMYTQLHISVFCPHWSVVVGPTTTELEL